MELGLWGGGVTGQATATRNPRPCITMVELKGKWRWGVQDEIIFTGEETLQGGGGRALHNTQYITQLHSTCKAPK